MELYASLDMNTVGPHLILGELGPECVKITCIAKYADQHGET